MRSSFLLCPIRSSGFASFVLLAMYGFVIAQPGAAQVSQQRQKIHSAGQAVTPAEEVAMPVYHKSADADAETILVRAPGPAWEAQHGLTQTQLQATFDELVARGYRLVHVSGYSVNGQALYAAIWEQAPGSAWETRFRLTSAQYQERVEELAARGYQPIVVSGYELAGQDYYAAIWEHAPWTFWEARYRLTQAQLQAEFDELVARGYRLVHYNGYSIDGQARYVAIWEYAPDSPAWESRSGLNLRQLQAKFDELVAEGYRPVHISGYNVSGEVQYAAIWERASGPAWEAWTGLTSTQYQKQFDELLAKGYRPIVVDGYEYSGQEYYAAVWEQTEEPTSVEIEQARDEKPSSPVLRQNYPNPFNPTTTIAYDVSEPSDVHVLVHDLLGKTVAVLVDEHHAAGHYEVTFDVGGLASGVYLYTLQAGDFAQTRRLVLLK